MGLDAADESCPPPPAVCAADNPASWGQNPSAKSIYASGFAWASQLIKGVTLATDYPLLLVDERAKDQVRARVGGRLAAIICPPSPGVPALTHCSSSTPRPALQVKVYLADFSQATDITNLYPVTNGTSNYVYFDSTTFSEREAACL